ncbi:MAG: hypothetical protein ACK40O_04635, partial [Allosphingosinicella sp.]
DERGYLLGTLRRDGVEEFVSLPLQLVRVHVFTPVREGRHPRRTGRPPASPARTMPPRRADRMDALTLVGGPYDGERAESGLWCRRRPPPEIVIARGGAEDHYELDADGRCYRFAGTRVRSRGGDG